ncbi:hypothetical protein [Agrococcus jejuensis]|uniref:hypothetical protein n=1 Tax=Agrococcus jejuensis TaxID=399736 RepID=UPI0011A02EAD|nr:hypothetical protein [Agrococcus jejuensis]
MLLADQRIITFSGDSLDAAATDLRTQIDDLPLTARITSLTSGCDEGVFSGMAIVDMIPEVDASAPVSDEGTVTQLSQADGLPDEI